MFNPFEKRASETLQQPESFLSLVTPEPADQYLSEHGSSGALWEKLVWIRGTPGAGKTTLARLFEYPTIAALLQNAAQRRDRQAHQHGDIARVLAACGAIRDDGPIVLGARLPLESSYRDLWELPYDESIRHGLMDSLLQSRAMLAWIRCIEEARLPIEDAQIATTPGSERLLELVGGPSLDGIRTRAASVELNVLRVLGFLVPPPADSLPREVLEAYHPFDVVQGIRGTIRVRGGREERTLRPLIMLDDAHRLHPQQRSHLQVSLVKRELKIARWVLSWSETAAIGELFDEVPSPQSGRVLPGLTSGRDDLVIDLQATETRSKKRFRVFAQGMSKRYIAQIPSFRRVGLDNLSSILPDRPPTLSRSNMERLHGLVASEQRTRGVPDEVVESIRRSIDEYATTSKSEDIRDEALQLAMLRVLMNRYAGRALQGSLFGSLVDERELEGLRAKASVAAAARTHLLHLFDRPTYYGAQTAFAAASQNIDQFIFLVAPMVNLAGSRLRRDMSPAIPAREQHRCMVERAEEALVEWRFPECERVRTLADAIGTWCAERSKEPNATLDGGPNAVGVLQEDFDRIVGDFPDLARVLHYGVAYRALLLTPNYKCKNKIWCLIRLSGFLVLHHRLTLRDGGFLELNLAELDQAMKQEHS